MVCVTGLMTSSEKACVRSVWHVVAARPITSTSDTCESSSLTKSVLSNTSCTEADMMDTSCTEADMVIWIRPTRPQSVIFCVRIDCSRQLRHLLK